MTEAATQFQAGHRIEIALPGGVTMAFRYCPAGRFRMGQRGERPDEEPVHWVTIPEGFWLGETPVTQAQFAAWADHENHFPGKPDHPAEQVTWEEGREFGVWLTAECGGAFPEGGEWIADLPDEARWEYACRAGTETEYHTGDGEGALAKAGWYGGNAGWQTQPVGRKAENAWGLHDMHGNVWEWCADVFDARAYRKRLDAWPARIWTLEDAGNAARYMFDNDRREKRPVRVLRGGSWSFSAGDCRAAGRNWLGPGFRDWFRGFRVCLARRFAGRAGQANREQAEAGTGGGARRDAAARPEVRDGAGIDQARETLPEKPACRGEFFANPHL